MNRLIGFFSYLISLSKFCLKTIGVLFSFNLIMQIFLLIMLSFESKGHIALRILCLVAITFFILSIIYYIFEARIYGFINKLFLVFFMILILFMKSSLFIFIGAIMSINIAVFILSYMESICRKKFTNNIQ